MKYNKRREGGWNKREAGGGGVFLFILIPMTQMYQFLCLCTNKVVFIEREKSAEAMGKQYFQM